jgi:hypothetical protein
MRFLTFLHEISHNLELADVNSRLNENSEQDIANVLDALKNAPSVDNRTAIDREEDIEDNRTLRNPLPSLSIDDPRFADWFDRGEDVLVTYANHKGWTIRDKGMVRAGKALGQKRIVPIDQLIGAETHLDPRGLNRKAGDKFSSDIPIIYKVDGNLFVTDGNHRIVQAHQEGQTEVEALVIDVNALEQKLN